MRLRDDGRDPSLSVPIVLKSMRGQVVFGTIVVISADATEDGALRGSLRAGHQIRVIQLLVVRASLIQRELILVIGRILQVLNVVGLSDWLEVDQSALGVLRIHNIRVVVTLSGQGSDVAHILLSEIVHKELLQPLKPGHLRSGLLLLLLILVVGLYVRELRGVDLKRVERRGLLLDLFRLIEAPHHILLGVVRGLVLRVLGGVQVPQVYSLGVHACHGGVQDHETSDACVMTLVRSGSRANQSVLELLRGQAPVPAPRLMT